MRAALLILAMTTGAYASDICPPECKPKTPTCEQRIARAKAAGCQMPVEVKIVDHRVEVPVPCPTCPTCAECPPPTEKIVEKVREILVEPVPQGHWLLGGGLMWQHKLGATVLGGYRFAGGRWEILGGPTWHNWDDTTGTVRYRCKRLPFHVESPSPWGVQALAVYAF